MAQGQADPMRLNYNGLVSTIYYALCPALAQCVADTLTAKSRTARSQPAWIQACRAISHGNVKNQCMKQSHIKFFPFEIQDFARLFVDMQYHREAADYDPTASFARAQVILWVERAQYALTAFNQVVNKDRQAFAVYVALPFRSSKPTRVRS